MSLLIIRFIFPLFHAIYIGVVEISSKDNNNGLEISIRLFTDDLEEAIRHDAGVGVLLRTPEELTLHAEMMDNYIKNKLNISVNGQLCSLDFVKSTNQDQATFLTYAIAHKEKIKTLGIINDLLVDVFPEQSNIVKVSVGGKPSFFKLDRANRSAEIKY